MSRGLGDVYKRQEIFINDGEQVMSAVIFTEQEAKGISFVAEGTAKIDVVKYDLI